MEYITSNPLWTQHHVAFPSSIAKLFCLKHPLPQIQISHSLSTFSSQDPRRLLGLLRPGGFRWKLFFGHLSSDVLRRCFELFNVLLSFLSNTVVAKSLRGHVGCRRLRSNEPRVTLTDLQALPTNHTSTSKKTYIAWYSGNAWHTMCVRCTAKEGEERISRAFY